MSKTVLVPHDFTSVARAAAKHALAIAKQTDISVTLLHITKSAGENRAALMKLEKEMEAIDGGGTEIKAKVLTGSIFTDIGKVAEQENAIFCVMGTHGAKGMQKVFGSFAIKVITSSSVPFIIVQEKEPAKLVENVVMPVDYQVENLQIMRFATELAKVFNAKMHLIAIKHSDASLYRKTHAHLKVVVSHLDKHEVKYEIAYLDNPKNYEQAIVDYTLENNADMVAISYYNERIIPQLDRFAQHMITNKEEIPVIIVNAKSVSSGYF